jgi:hypothetical protein
VCVCGEVWYRNGFSRRYYYYYCRARIFLQELLLQHVSRTRRPYANDRQREEYRYLLQVHIPCTEDNEKIIVCSRPSLTLLFSTALTLQTPLQHSAESSVYTSCGVPYTDTRTSTFWLNGFTITPKLCQVYYFVYANIIISASDRCIFLNCF